MTEDELNRLIDLRIGPGDGLYERAYAAHLITGTNQKAQRQLLAARLRSRMSFLQHVTPLHIFVVTLRCEHSCPYCQVSRQSTDRSRFDMSEETAMRALDIAFASPAARIKIEFQGGEPLLNFPMIKTIVAAAKSRSGKKVDFVIASNLALLDDVVLDFCKANYLPIRCQHRPRVCRPRWFRCSYLLRSLTAIRVSYLCSGQRCVHLQDDGSVRAQVD